MSVKLKLELLGNALIIICGSFSFLMFSHVWLFNQFIWQVNPILLMIAGGLIALIGLERLLCDLLRHESILEYIGDSIIIFFGGWLAFKAGLMLEFGIIHIIEPNLLILSGETIASLALIVLGVKLTIKDIRYWRMG